jgi:hypothetical protein
MMWLYDIPTWALGVVVLTATVAASIGGFLLLHRIFPGERNSEVAGLAVSFIGVVCAFHSLLIAFSAVLVWQDFQDSEKAVATEANAAADIFRDLGIYGGADAEAAQRTLARYVRVVIDEEWPAMAEGRSHPKAQELLEQVFVQAGSLDPKTPREQVVFGEIFSHLNQLMANRQERLSDAESQMPGLFWAIVLLATVLLIAYTAMLPSTRTNLAMVAGMAAAVGLIFFFIVAMDHPFAGETGVDQASFKTLLIQMEARLSTR